MSTSVTANLPKCPTGIEGFDAIPRGDLPVGRSPLVAGRANGLPDAA